MFPGVEGFFTSSDVPMSDRVNGRWMHAFSSREAFARVQAGYGCGSCLAKFTMYFAVCPVCGTRRDVGRDVQDTPPDWQQYWDQHNYGTGDGKGGPTQVRGPEEFLADLAKDPDVDQVKMSQLKPSKWGRGRPK